MKKEEILAMSRKENKNKDIYEIEVENKGCKIAVICMLILICIYYCYEIITGKGQNYTLYSLISIYCTILYGYKAIKLEKRRKLHTFCAVLWGLMTIILILQYFKVI